MNLYKKFLIQTYNIGIIKKPIGKILNNGIKKGDILCIVESMKLMNEIESEFDGEVVEICAKNEEMVEYGKPLFKIKKECD